MKNTFMPPQIILRNNGNTYYSTATNVIGKEFCSNVLDSLKNNTGTNKYFVLELAPKELIVRAAQKTFEGAMKYFNDGDNTKRIIAHFDENLLYITK